MKASSSIILLHPKYLLLMSAKLKDLKSESSWALGKEEAKKETQELDK